MVGVITTDSCTTSSPRCFSVPAPQSCKFTKLQGTNDNISQPAGKRIYDMLVPRSVVSFHFWVKHFPLNHDNRKNMKKTGKPPDSERELTSPPELFFLGAGADKRQNIRSCTTGSMPSFCHHLNDPKRLYKCLAAVFICFTYLKLQCLYVLTRHLCKIVRSS